MTQQWPQPQPADVDLARSALHLRDVVGLRDSDTAERSCRTCYFYLTPTDAVSYCWNERLRCLVAGSLVCDEHRPALAG